MKKLVTLVWWPHSGGRWLSRSIMKKHSKVSQTTFVHPWIFNSSDDCLSLDITSQVHKARSLPALSLNLEALKSSTDVGRITGLKHYFNFIREGFEFNEEIDVIFGESCLGSPNPKHIELESIFSSYPEMRIIHLVRNPIDSFDSFKNREEMDGNPIKIAGSWAVLNANIREYFLNDGLKYSSQYLIVRYEDLIKDLENQVRKICSFCDIEFENIMISGLDEQWGKGTSSNLDKDKSSLMTSIASSELKNYGYL